MGIHTVIVISFLRFLKKGSLTSHLRSHGLDLGGGLVCQHCGKTYNDRELLYSHFLCMHKEMECDKCGAKVAGWQGRNLHTKKFHPTEKDARVNCPDCGKSLANERQLTAHRYMLHVPESERPVPCPHCDRR